VWKAENAFVPLILPIEIANGDKTLQFNGHIKLFHDQEERSLPSAK